MHHDRWMCLAVAVQLDGVIKFPTVNKIYLTAVELTVSTEVSQKPEHLLQETIIVPTWASAARPEPTNHLNLDIGCYQSG